jgi:hypothetical protein
MHSAVGSLRSPIAEGGLAEVPAEAAEAQQAASTVAARTVEALVVAEAAEEAGPVAPGPVLVLTEAETETGSTPSLGGTVQAAPNWGMVTGHCLEQALVQKVPEAAGWAAPGAEG